MRNFTKIIFFASVFFFVNQAVAQSYSSNREKFVKEFQKNLSDYGKGDFHDFVKNDLPVLLLESNDFSDVVFTQMVATCNLLEEKKFKPYPEIYNYVFSLSSLVKSKQPTASYNAWHSSVDKLLDSRYVKKFEDFIEMSASFFSERKIAASSNFEWFYLNGTYQFEFDNKAYIKFQNGNLVCRAISNRTDHEILDSLVVYNASGSYDPNLKKWEGENGKITWDKVGLDGTKTFAVLKSFDLSLKTSTMRVDSVTLTTPYFSKPIEGMLTDRAFKINREEDKIYPQFLSFESKLLIKEIVPDVDYLGGFSLQGSNFMGTGSNDVPAKISLKRNGTVFITARAPLIIVTPQKITIQKSETALFLKSGDSLYHPGLDFNYDLEKKSVQMVRTKNGIGESPFQDSYHQLDIYAPKLNWIVGTDLLDFTYEFGTSQEQKMATFESKAYFDARVYDGLAGLGTVHPLVALSRYSYKYDEPLLTEGAASSALGLTVEQAKSILLKLSTMGFITYDTEGKTVRLNDKLETFVRSKSGTKDYDNIVFSSDLRPKELKGYSPEEIAKDEYLSSIQKHYDAQNEKRRLMKNFGTIDLSTLDLSLNAIDNVVVSASKNVVVFPEGSEVLVRKNRDFNFSGWVNAGKIETNTVAASFEYDTYKIKLLETENSVFRVRPLRQEDGLKSIPMVSSLTGVAGELFIDDPSNRSGNNVKFEHYPILKATSKAKIFYNSKDIFRGVYDSTRFYYTLEPFELDSLNGFKESALRLKGSLTSAGIFPVFKEEIQIMPDYSFGFSTKAPTGGFQFYGTDAKYENKVILSHNGLQGAGTINFINSTSVSKGLSFLPDSTVGIAKFVNRPSETGIQFPPVLAEEAYITYVPKKNILKAASMPKQNLDFFGGEAKMKGTAIISPKGMTGIGLMTFETATLISDNFKYKRYDIDADTSSFNLKNDNEDVSEDPLSFKTDNVTSHVSFKERKGEFTSNQGESTVEFPLNQYMCKMDKFTWFMDDYAIEMERQQDRDVAINSGVDLKGPNFYSTHPKQDSLQFMAPKAKFSIKDKTIYCDKVEYIDIADARIFPDSMKLNIRKKAKIDKLVNSEIVANYITKYHKFVKSEVEILARRDYKASGEYAYYDLDSNITYIVMKDIGLDTAYQTKAHGVIDQSVNFKLSPKFDYYGDMHIRASNPTVLFKGATRINHECDKFDRNWMSFTAELDPKNIQIPVQSDMKDLDGGPISAGIVWRDSPVVDSIALYPTFLSKMVSADDPKLMSASGFLQYNDDAKEFQIGSKNKLLNRSEAGTFIALHTESCSMNGEGEISLGMDFGDAEVSAVGVVNYNQATGETSMNLTTKFTMPLDKGIFQDVAKRINEIEGLKPMDFASTTLEQAIVEWDGVAVADEFKSKFTIDGVVKKVPDSFSKSITFSGVRLSSFEDKQQNRGLITNVESAVLVNVYGEPVMKYVPFKAFFQQIYSGGGGDRFTYFLNIPGGRDYFMYYSMNKKDGTLRIKSGDQEFNTALSEMKEDKRKTKNFLYESTTNSVYVNKFLELFAE